MQTLVGLSKLYQEEHQSKCQAAISSVGTVGAVISGPLYSRVLFSATSVGVSRALPSLVLMGLGAVCQSGGVASELDSWVLCVFACLWLWRCWLAVVGVVGVVGVAPRHYLRNKA